MRAGMTLRGGELETGHASVMEAGTGTEKEGKIVVTATATGPDECQVLSAFWSFST